jgi:1,2-diacylglycerol 3-beta-galactosyltransferase
MTVLTDPADFPPHFWIEKQEQVVVCGTEKACQQAREIGLAEEQISRVSGMIVHPRFYRLETGNRNEGRRLLGLDPERATGLVSFGGQGSKTMLAIARQVEEQVRERGVDVQMIFICGHNERLRRRLAEMPTSYPKRVEGFTREMPVLMSLADFFVGKPGPGSISEALLMGLPVVLKGFGGILPQERYNLEWVRDEGVGLVVERAGELGATLARILEPTDLAELRGRVARQRNRAVFEVVDLLVRQLGEEPAEDEDRQVA